MTRVIYSEKYLKNNFFELAFLPDFGCHWTKLRILVKGKWLDLLYPVSDLSDPELGLFMLAPWSNRIVDGSFPFEGKRHQLRINFPDHTAIHGDVRSRPWNVKAAESKFEAMLDSRKFSDFNYPFALVFEHSVELLKQKLRVSLFIKNVDQSSVPVGLGFHPYFHRRLTEKDSDVMLILPAEKVSPDEKCIPTAPPVPVSGPADLRREQFLGNPNLDHCYTELTKQEVRLIYPGTKIEARLTLDPVYSHVIIYAPINDEGRPRDYFSVEPVTHVNNGFNLHAKGWKNTGVKVLKPGERLEGSWELSVLEQ